MDLTRPVSYRGLLLNGADGGPGGDDPIDGMRLVRVRYSDVPAVGYTEKRSLEDGLDASDVFLGGRTLTLQGEVFASNKGRLFDALDLLRLKFTATDAYAESPATRGYLPLSFSQPTELTVHYPGGFIDRELRVRPLTQPEHDIEWLAIGGKEEGGYVVPYVAQAQAKDPRFYAPTPVEDFITGLSGSGSFVNKGNYPTPLQTLLFIPGSSPGEATYTFTGLGTDMVITIPASGSARFVQVDSTNKIVTLTIGSTETLRMDLVEFNAGTTWPKVPPVPEGDSPAGYSWTSDIALAAPSRLFFHETWS